MSIRHPTVSLSRSPPAWSNTVASLKPTPDWATEGDLQLHHFSLPCNMFALARWFYVSSMFTYVPVFLRGNLRLHPCAWMVSSFLSFSPHLCVGFLFLVVHLRLCAPAPARRPHTTYSHTHNLSTHNLLTNNLSTHNLSTHNLLTHNLYT